MRYISGEKIIAPVTPGVNRHLNKKKPELKKEASHYV